jgi:hypothetical protein
MTKVSERVIETRTFEFTKGRAAGKTVRFVKVQTVFHDYRAHGGDLMQVFPPDAGEGQLMQRDQEEIAEIRPMIEFMLEQMDLPADTVAKLKDTLALAAMPVPTEAVS